MKFMNATILAAALLAGSVSMAGLSLPPEIIKTQGLSLPPDEQSPPVSPGDPIMVLPDGTVID